MCVCTKDFKRLPEGKSQTPDFLILRSVAFLLDENGLWLTKALNIFMSPKQILKAFTHCTCKIRANILTVKNMH